MRTLAIDSATEACSVALFEGETLIAGDCRVLGRGHAEHLVPMIAALPEKGMAGRIAVSLGPGSFTGVRVGLAAAKALAFAWGAELTGYPTLSLVAAMARAERGNQDIVVAMTGGHGEWFVEAFDGRGAPVRPLASMPPETAATAAEFLAAGSQAEVLIGLRGHGEAMTILPDARAFSLLLFSSLSKHVRPIYGRSPDARLPVSAP